MVSISASPPQRYVFNMNGAAPLTNNAESVWSFDGKVYCAYQANSNALSRQVVQVFPEGANVTNSEIPAVPIFPLDDRRSNSEDGLNCLNVSSVPLQIVSTSATNSASCVSTIQGLNVTTGLYTPICSTAPGECFLSCAIDPSDGMIYCQTTSTPRYLARMTCDPTTGALEPCYMGRVNTNNDPLDNSAAFKPSDGEYVYAPGDGNRLREVRGDITNIDAFVSRPDPALPFISSPRASGQNFNADALAIARFTFSTQGEQDWAVGCAGSQVIVMSVTGSSVRYVLDMVGVDVPGGEVTTAWSFEDHVYCACNDTIYEILYEFVSTMVVTAPLHFQMCPGCRQVTTTTTTTTTTLPPPLQLCLDLTGVEKPPSTSPIGGVGVDNGTMARIVNLPALADSEPAWNCSNSSEFSTLALQVINEQPFGLPARQGRQAGVLFYALLDIGVAPGIWDEDALSLLVADCCTKSMKPTFGHDLAMLRDRFVTKLEGGGGVAPPSEVGALCAARPSEVGGQLCHELPHSLTSVTNVLGLAGPFNFPFLRKPYRGTIQSLDVTTGTYVRRLVSQSRHLQSRLICKFEGECFNACGVNPLDNNIYCITEAT
ncbi:unnamed protein product [Symbiodinium natans]|uniref:Uncharacterized protein n=1 Tax=Symbiodinium natans TaxID=878477 RepID=A0A812LMN6_9DINO|nr:unnamed protein product [Symbiodinium natans]